jgi:hypothetical protein
MNDASLTTQYLHWALAAAHRVESPDCEKVIVEVNLKTLGTTTRFVKKGQGEKDRPLISLREATVLRLLFDARIAKLTDCIGKAAGSLYPGIWSNEINELEAMFLRLTGYPLNDEQAEAMREKPTPIKKGKSHGRRKVEGPE